MKPTTLNSDVFVLAPELRGLLQSISRSWWGRVNFMLVILEFGALLFALPFVLTALALPLVVLDEVVHGRTDQVDDMLIGTFFWDAFVGCFVLYAWESWMKRCRLVARGQFLRGEIRSVTKEFDEDNDLWVDLGYEFHTPAGALLRGQQRRVRNDLKNASLPREGTPVLVLFADPECYLLL